ncbi:MAG: hypothetical protein QHJ82_02450 [Verrucomicrobiota bacterium]|nr:hypothetical protein [Verrucomicrobiota bacterium]
MTVNGNISAPSAVVLPRMAMVQQLFADNPAIDIEETVRQALAGPAKTLKPNAQVAVAVGSRGITNLETIVSAAVATLKSAGAQPFVLPAMGSHGGGTSTGQTALLADFGLTQSRLGVPIRAAMDTQLVGVAEGGIPVVVGVEALRADAVLLISRVKPHTDFSGGIGSGLLKMLVVGLGKRAGATNFHRAAAVLGHETVLRKCARVLLENLPLLGGLAIVENQRHATARIEYVSPKEFERRDEALCAMAREMMPTLPFDSIDLLIVDRMGKNISGTGMDPAIIGRTVHGYSLEELPGHPPPKVRRLFVRELRPESRGNAIGIGLADFTTQRLVRAIDARATALNALTALSLQAAKVPIHFDTDLEAIQQALATLPQLDHFSPRVVRIRDTLSVEFFQASENCLTLPEAAGRIVPRSEPQPMSFDGNGNLTLPWT